MTDVTSAFFEQLAARGYEPQLHSVTGTYKINVGDRSWGIIVNEGAITMTNNHPKADTTFTSSEEVFARMVRGEQNPTTAFMQGILQVTGDVSMAQMFQRLLRNQAAHEEPHQPQRSPRTHAHKKGASHEH